MSTTDRPNLAAPEVRADPYPVYAALRERAPACPLAAPGMWAICRHRDVIAALQDTARFSSVGRTLALAPWLTRFPLRHSMNALDPPEHTRLRALVGRAFGAAAVARLEPAIRDIAHKLAAEVTAQRDVDFVAAFAQPLPALVICDLLGLDRALHPRFKEWADALAQLYVPGHTPEQIAFIQRSFADMDHDLREVIQARRAAPQNDLVSDLLRAEPDGRPLTEDELLGFMSLLLMAGLETTVHLLSNTLLTLARHPDVLARVHADLGLVPALVEEVLRYEPPVHALLRHVREDVEVSGVTLPRGSIALLVLAAAARDPRRFVEPDRFLLDRDDRGNLPFGHGAHYCIGAALARLEARLALEALLPRVREVRRSDDAPLRWNHAITLRGPVALPLRLS